MGETADYGSRGPRTPAGAGELPAPRFPEPAGGSGVPASGEPDAPAPQPPLPRRVAGLLLGCLTAPVGLLYFVLVGLPLGPLLLWPRTRPAALRWLGPGARVLAAAEHRRRVVFFADRFPARRLPDRRLPRYLAARTCTGLVTGFVLLLLVFGAGLAALLAAGLLRGSVTWPQLLGQALLGAVLLFLNVQGLRSLAAHDARLARACFGPTEQEALRQRITQLATSRAAVLRAVDGERRRIERDLHDGVQQRLVALAMLLGRARRHREPARANELLRQAHQEAQDVLHELREVTWRVYPAVLDDLGLREALAGVCERSGVPVRVDYDVPGPLPAAVETAAYFVVSESVTNTTKHASASTVSVSVRRSGGTLVVRVRDDGTGGADPAGGGLSGLRDRVGALDGRLHVDSPSGGPTTITAQLPCA
ncbi:sensor histidine kinase [Streptomyces albus]|uniref:sensor histidine kinase n=1 Tax=Streptomyces albus TaxID=1888 RepID=UPI0024ACD0BE|nr:sensor histidine kinase [Streptomyces albus]MDI6412181.1 sensor histidine kinase [Streptomyces albus]